MSTVDAAATPLEVRGLIRRFGDRVVVADFSLTVQSGESVALAGPNGAGKSTVLRLLAGLLRPDAGSGQIAGCDMRRMTAQSRNAVGYLPQRSALYARLSALENLRFRTAVAGLDRPRQRAQAVADALGLGRRARERLAGFSGGWIRRIELAATLIPRPLLVLLDEPTHGLDEAARDAIWDALDAHRRSGGAIVFSSHDSAELARADRVLRLSPTQDRVA